MDTIHLGDIYADVKLPRHEWRIVEERDRERFTLERVDKPTIMRFLDGAALHDPRRYRRTRIGNAAG